MQETFRNRFGLIAALLGMAIGTGNIWRFPRVMAQNGGGAFLIPWFIFLFLWSIPLLIVEFSCGQKLRQGVAGCFSTLSNGKLTWLGGFVVVCTLGIMFYYSVVTGWCLYYLGSAASGGLFQTDPKNFWESFSQNSFLPLLFHVISILLTVLIIFRGVQKGIEAANRIMVPSLFAILIFLAGYAMTLSGRSHGLEFIFNTDFSRLRDYRVWLEALTQSAWSTGAGWGIALTYACYAREHDNPVLTPFTTGLGNNSAELFAGLAIVPTLFSFFPLSEVVDLTKSGNTGLTFIALPRLLQQMPLGRFIAILFFVALFFAAFTSLFSMFELGVYFLTDLGFPRRKSIFFLAFLAVGIGAPSALNLQFLDNQDWAWGIGLLLSGFFFSLLMRHVGMEKFCREFVPLRTPFHRFVFEFIVFWLIPFEFLALLGWWFSQAIHWDPAGWWNPFHKLSVGTCLVQWGIALGIFFILNRKISGRITAHRP
jgi:NSS family neurotransmitter:Na+ symporter